MSRLTDTGKRRSLPLSNSGLLMKNHNRRGYSKNTSQHRREGGPTPVKREHLWEIRDASVDCVDSEVLTFQSFFLFEEIWHTWCVINCHYRSGVLLESSCAGTFVPGPDGSRLPYFPSWLFFLTLSHWSLFILLHFLLSYFTHKWRRGTRKLSVSLPGGQLLFLWGIF